MDVENHRIQYVKKTIELKSKVEDCRIRLSQINDNNSRTKSHDGVPLSPSELHRSDLRSPWLFLPSLPALSFTEMWISLVRTRHEKNIGQRANLVDILVIKHGEFRTCPTETPDFLMYPLVIFPPENYGKNPPIFGYLNHPKHLKPWWNHSYLITFPPASPTAVPNHGTAVPVCRLSDLLPHIQGRSQKIGVIHLFLGRQARSLIKTHLQTDFAKWKLHPI